MPPFLGWPECPDSVSFFTVAKTGDFCSFFGCTFLQNLHSLMWGAGRGTALHRTPFPVISAFVRRSKHFSLLPAGFSLFCGFVMGIIKAKTNTLCVCALFGGIYLGKRQINKLVILIVWKVQRLNEIARLGFRRCIIPRQGTDKLDAPEGLELLRVRNIREAIEIAL